MNILIYIQHSEGRLLKLTLAALQAASQLKERWSKNAIVGVCFGPGAQKAANEAAQYGISEVYYSEANFLQKFLPRLYSTALAQVFKQSGSDTVVAGASSVSKDLLPCLAALVDGAMASDVLALNADGSLKRAMYAGNVIADIELCAANKLLTIRATAFSPAVKQGSVGKVQELNLDAPDSFGEVLNYEISKSERPELAEAEVVVSGGRALQSAENFQKYIFPLADALGAAVGASRAAVDSGYAPNDWQVGQTGKVVAPSLYFAVGISGAIQHLAGMKDSKVIVAINKDADAPIFEVADYGLVADLYEVVLPLADAIKRAKAG